MTTELITDPLLNEVEREERMFQLAQRKAKVYTSSTLVPKEFQGDKNIGNVLIAQNMAQRMGADVLQVMQNLYVVHGKPGWSAQFLIACFNTCGRFTAIKYRFNQNKTTCVAYATELATGEIIEGSEVSIKMADAEGWSTKAGSKWKTMPEQMLRYRAAAFLIRTVAPEIGMGLMTREELADTGPERHAAPATADIMARLQPPAEAATDDQDDVTWEDVIKSAGDRETLLEVLADIEDSTLDAQMKESLARSVKAKMEAM